MAKQEQAMSSQWAVELKAVSHRYGKKQALEQINCQLPKGRTIGLIGPDGVGKSTLLSLIAGVKIIQTGSVQVLDGDMRKKSIRQYNSQRIAFMPQGLGKNLYPTLSIIENIEFHARLFGLNKNQRASKMARLMQATGLLPFKDRAAGKLSGGMKQKLSLCCALVHDPELLILDEPTTGVDPLSRQQFWDLVDNLRQDLPDMTVIVATAYIDEAERFEYLLAMDNGKLLCCAPTQQVLQDTQSQTLEQAYIRLLPQQNDHPFDFNKIPPFIHDPEAQAVMLAQNLSKEFGEFKAVDNVNFRIEQGEIFGFLGSNGCGKSTTMKMLTGLLEPSSGQAQLLGKDTNAKDINMRMRVGYMSQSFSLYEELTVEQNLNLHGRLYQMTSQQTKQAVKASLAQFELMPYRHHKPVDLSLGIRQRLQLAAACLHKPEVLILDEPTSGVDPAARDMFWGYLIQLSRQDKITIFVSTHFMNEASWCDRISLMHQGKVLAQGTPEELRSARNAATLEEAFIDYLKEANGLQEAPSEQDKPHTATPQTSKTQSPKKDVLKHSSWRNILAFTLREGKELMRDPIRLMFAILAPICLVVTSALGISLDIKNVSTSILDRDQTQISRDFANQFTTSEYFSRKADIYTQAQVDEVMHSGKIRLVVDIPPNFGKQLMQGQKPEVGFYIDGSLPFLASNVRGFVAGIVLNYAQQLASQRGIKIKQESLLEPRFMFNQNFKSVISMTPGMIMMALMLIPVAMTALGVVRERELGSITNLYASPAKVFEFLIGKQIPYIILAFISYLSLIWLAIILLKVPIKGSFPALAFGGFALICASTALGLLISCFVRSQVAAIFGSAILSLVPALNFSGLLFPVSALSKGNQMVSISFPSSWFQRINLGGFAKGLSWADFTSIYLILFGFAIAYILLANLFLKKQEV